MVNIVIRIIALFLCLMVVSVFSSQAEAHESPIATLPFTYAITINGDPSLPMDFKHFPYANPNAPKGGLLRRYALGTFDTINPFCTKGRLPEGFTLMHDSLTVGSLDDPNTEYGLIADGICLAPDRSWIIFSINPKARFQDGSPITAEDVAFSYEATLHNLGSAVQQFFSDITEISVLDSRHIRFSLAPTASRELPLHIGRMAVYSQSFWSQHDIGVTGLYPVIGSGPYRINMAKSHKDGRQVVYERVQDYWAADLPVCRGHYNFVTIQYDYYRDANVALEAFKAGLYDVREENTAKVWDTLYTGSLFDNGTIVKKSFPHSRPLGMQGFFFNTRKDLFKDIRVRRAISLAFDFEWSNRQYFRNAYTRTTSYFFNTDLASPPLPSDEERELLQPFMTSLSLDIFTKPHTFPTSDGSGYNRQNLIKAAALLDEAGWQLKDGQRINAQGEPLRFQLLVDSQSMRKLALPFALNLRRLGIEMVILMPDTALFLRRLQDFNYDMVSSGIGSMDTPGGELRLYWHSDSYNFGAGRNLAGVALPVVDFLVESIATAPHRHALQVACHALDRVLLWQNYVIPLGASAEFRIAYQAHLAQPKISPKGAVGILTWWVK